jgi:methyl-accepting chemotaxis protein
MLKDLPVFTKILLLALVIVVVLSGAAYYAVNGMGGLGRAMEAMYQDDVVPLALIGNIKAGTMENAKDVVEHISSTDPARLQQLEENIEKKVGEINTWVAKCKEANLSEEEQKLLAQFESALQNYRSQRAEILEYSRSGREEEAWVAYHASELARAAIIEPIETLVVMLQEGVVDAHQTQNQRFMQIRRNVIGIIVAAVAVSLLSSLGLGRMISKPLNKLKLAAEKVSTGDLTQITQLNSRDELGDLAASLGTMVQGLRSLVKNVQDNARQVAALSQQLNAATEENAQAIGQTTEVAQELASGSEKQNQNVQNITAVLEEMSAGIEEISASTEELSSTAEETSSLASRSSQGMKLAGEEAERIYESTHKVAEVINEVGKQSENIGHIVGLINSIADQTNLLALNAAIEAARAGEHGQGFAVVADEVRKLAEQAQTATRDIAGVIEKMQADVGRAVQAMSENAQLVEKSSQVITRGAAAFAEIYQAVEGVSGQTQQVSMATEEIAQGSEEVVQAIQEVSQVAQQVAASSQNLAASTEEQSASMQEIAASADTLSRVAQELMQTVANLKV